MRIRMLVLIGVLALLPAPGAHAQPSFDAASVKIDNGPFVPGVSGYSRGGPGTSDPGRITYTQQNLKIILQRAYDVMPDQINGPDWLDDYSTGKFTITATMPPNTTKEDFQLMLQNLLTERFRITLHHEIRNFPGYDLIVASGGPKLNRWTPEPNPDTAAPAPAGRDERGFPRLRPGQPGGSIAFPFGGSGIIRMTARESMADFAKGLGNRLNMATAASPGSTMPRVTDKTGLEGLYEFKLEFEGTAIRALTPPPVAAGEASALPVASDPGSGGPTLFTALEKQLGLKLVKAKNVAVDVLVIDHIEKIPLEN